MGCNVCWQWQLRLEREWYVSCQVTAALLVFSLVGSRLDFLTVLYITILLSLTLPIIYLKCQDRLKASAEHVKMDGQRLWQMVDEKVARKIKKNVSREKKNE